MKKKLAKNREKLALTLLIKISIISCGIGYVTILTCITLLFKFRLFSGESLCLIQTNTQCNEAGTHVELTQLKKQLATHEYDERLGDIYGSSSKEINSARERLEALVEWYAEEFGSVEGASDVALYTAPGRTEMGGNHTDHQQGAVLAGSVTLDMVACAAPNGTRTARIMSQGYPEIAVDLRDLVPVAGEEGTSQLVRSRE